MDTNLTCSQVIALLTFYVQGKTNYQVTNFIQAHLAKCESCRNEQVQGVKSGLKAAVGVAGAVVSLAAIVVTKGKVNPKK